MHILYIINHLLLSCSRVFAKTLVKYEIVFYIDTGIIISQQVPVTLIIDFYHAICQLLWKVVYS